MIIHLIIVRCTLKSKELSVCQMSRVDFKSLAERLPKTKRTLGPCTFKSLLGKQNQCSPLVLWVDNTTIERARDCNFIFAFYDDDLSVNFLLILFFVY